MLDYDVQADNDADANLDAAVDLSDEDEEDADVSRALLGHIASMNVEGSAEEPSSSEEDELAEEEELPGEDCEEVAAGFTDGASEPDEDIPCVGDNGGDNFCIGAGWMSPPAAFYYEAVRQPSHSPPTSPPRSEQPHFSPPGSPESDGFGSELLMLLLHQR
jgi:hypothetical protein